MPAASSSTTLPALLVRRPLVLVALALVAATASASLADDRVLDRWLATATRALDAGSPRRARPLLVRAAARAPSDPRVVSLVSRLLPTELEALVQPSEEVLRDAAWVSSLAARVAPDTESAHVARLDAWSEALRGRPVAASFPLTPQDHEGAATLRRIAALALRRGEVDEALVALRRAHAAFPQQPRGLRDLSALLVARGRPGEAVQLLRTRLRIEPDDVETQRDLGLALLADGREADALATLEGVARGGEAPDLLRYAAVALETGRLREAASAASRAAARSDGRPQQRANAVRGLALLALGQHAAAREALRLAPDDARAREALRLIESRP